MAPLDNLDDNPFAALIPRGAAPVEDNPFLSLLPQARQPRRQLETIDQTPIGVARPEMMATPDDIPPAGNGGFNLARGIGERALNLAGGVVRFTGQTSDELADWLNERVPLGAVDADAGGIRWRPWTKEEAAQPSPLLPAARALEGAKLGYQPGTTWEDVKASPLSKFLPFAFEQGIVSIPDMAAAIYNLPGYVISRIGEIGQTRAGNDKRKDATVGDMIAAAPAAVASALLERLGTRGILGMGRAPITGPKELAAEVGKAGVREGGTEALQEGAEYTAETAGTARGFNLAEGGERMLAGAVGGAPFGAAVRTATGTAEMAGSAPAQDMGPFAALVPGTAPAPAPAAAPQPVAPTAPAQPAATSAPGIEPVFTSRGRRVETRPEVIEGADLIASHNDDMAVNPRYPAELQPRDRGRAASQAQVQDIAANLEPERLGRSSSAVEGAPIVGEGNIIESGNARTLAILRAFQQGLPGGQRYRAWLTSQGFNVDGMKAPVFIRRRVTPLDSAGREAFTREANEKTVMGMSAAEQASADAKALPTFTLELYKGGDLNAAGNRGAVNAFIGSLPASERGSLVAPDGSLSLDGLRRFQNALFSYAYDDAELLSAVREYPDTNIKAIGDGLMDAAPAWSRLRKAIAAKQAPAELDITKQLIAAVGIVRRARDNGQRVGDMTRQGDMLGGQVAPETVEILRLMFADDKFTRPRSKQRIAEALAYYATEAAKAQASPGLFAGAPQVKAADILKMARTRLDGGGMLPGLDTPPIGDAMPGLAEANNPFAALTPAGETMDEVAEVAGPGAQYKGLIKDKYDPAVPATGKPIRREDILREFAKGMGLPFYKGRIKDKGTLGFFRARQQEVRLKNASDIEVAAHEMAHALDHNVPEIRRQWTPASKANAAIRAELRGVSYDKSKLYEGFAEFVRLFMTQTNEAATRAPQFFAWFEGFVARSEYGPTLTKARQEMTAWYDQAALDRARSKVGATEEINAGLARPTDSFRQSVFDDLQGILIMEQDLTGATSPIGAYVTARLTRGKTAIIEGALNMGAPKVRPDGSHTFDGKGLRQILEPVTGRLDDALMYFVGRSARELQAQGRERLFTPAEITSMLALETPAFRQAFDEYQVWNSAVLDFAQAKGLIDPQQRASWKRNEYLPFYRVGASSGKYTRVAGEFKGIKALVGGRENIREVLGNMVQNAASLLDAALTNEARLKIADLAGGPRGARFMAKIPKDERNVKVHRAEVERSILQALGVSKRAQLTPEQDQVFSDIISNLDTFVWFQLKNQSPQGENVVAVMRNGKAEFYEVGDPILLRSWLSLNRPVPNWLIKVFSWPRRVGQATITLEPTFIAANFARDTLMGWIMSRHGFRPLIESARGLKARIFSDPDYREFIANGGGLSSHLLNESMFRTSLEKFYRKKGITPQLVMDIPSRIIEGMERIGDAFEIATRLGEFKRAKDRGQNARYAAFSAREISTDFAMRGDNSVIGFFYDSSLFLKAAVVSLDRFYRGISKDENRAAIAIKVGMVAILSMALYAINKDNPLYDDLEDWDRDNFWHFFIPTVETFKAWEQGKPTPPPEKAYTHLRMPKLWEVGSIASIAERTVEGFVSGQPVEAGKHFLRILRQTFGVNPIPQLLAPGFETMANFDMFTGRPIVTKQLQELEPWAQATPQTASILRKAGEAVRGLPRDLQYFSPALAQHLLEGYFNSFAATGLAMADAILYDDNPDMRVDQYPVLRRFYRQEPAQSTKHVTQLYKAIEEATELRRGMRFLDRTYRPHMSDEIERRIDTQLYGQLNAADRRLRAFRKETENVTRAPGLSDLRQIAADRAKSAGTLTALAVRSPLLWNKESALRRYLLDDITRDRNQYAKTANTNVRAQRKQLEQPPAAP